MVTMIHMQLWALDTTHHAAFNKTAKCTSLQAPKYAQKNTPDCNRLHIPCLLDLRSQLSCQDAPKYTLGHAPKDAPNCTQWHPPTLLDYSLPSKLTKCSQAHSRARFQVHSQLHLMIHQQQTLPSGRNGCVRVDALCQSCQRHPDGRLLCARRQHHASGCISPSACSFAISHCTVRTSILRCS